MAQGWSIASDGTSITIKFYEPPPAGTDNVKVIQRSTSGNGGTDVFALGAWGESVGWPAEGEFFGDRLWLASTPTDPQVMWGSCIGDYTNHGRSSPIVDSDAVSFAINSRQVNVIKELVPLDSLLVLTTGGEYRVGGGSDDVITPSTISVKNQGNSGTGDVPAKVIGESALFMQDEGQKVRDLRYQFEKDGFRGNDIGVWADHLFTGHIITGIDYWKAPWQVVWYTRDDGVRIGCTYMPEQEVSGWHWHDTAGLYLDCCSLPGRLEGETYMLTERMAGGRKVRMIEKQAPTFFKEEVDLFYVDAGLTYDGRNRSGATVELASISGGWSEGDDLSITASADMFVGPSDVGDGFDIRAMATVEREDGSIVVEAVSVRVVLDEVVTAVTAKCHSVGDVPMALRDTPVTGWTFQRDTIGGLWHLEGSMASVLQDGAVVGPLLVEGGRVRLASPGGVVHVGHGYMAEVETLEINAPGGEPLRDQMKLSWKASILVNGTRGILAGAYRDELYPVAERRDEPYGTAPYLRSGVIDCLIPSVWHEDAGRVRIVSSDPLPMELLSITLHAVASNGQAGAR